MKSTSEKGLFTFYFIGKYKKLNAITKSRCQKQTLWSLTTVLTKLREERVFRLEGRKASRKEKKKKKMNASKNWAKKGNEFRGTRKPGWRKLEEGTVQSYRCSSFQNRGTVEGTRAESWSNFLVFWCLFLIFTRLRNSPLLSLSRYSCTLTPPILSFPFPLCNFLPRHRTYQGDVEKLRPHQHVYYLTVLTTDRVNVVVLPGAFWINIDY